MTEHEINDVSFALGGIKSQLEAVLRTQSEDRTASAQYRTDIRKELQKTNDVIATVKTDVTIAKNDIAKMKPTVESLDQRAMMSKGAANFAIVLGKFAHLIAAALGGVVALLLDKWLHGK